VVNATELFNGMVTVIGLALFKVTNLPVSVNAKV